MRALTLIYRTEHFGAPQYIDFLYFACIGHLEGFVNTVGRACQFLTGNVTRKCFIHRSARCEAMRCDAHSVAWGDAANGGEGCTRDGVVARRQRGGKPRNDRVQDVAAGQNRERTVCVCVRVCVCVCVCVFLFLFVRCRCAYLVSV